MSDESASPCPSVEALERAAIGDAQDLAPHLAVCAACREVFAAITADDPLLAEVAALHPPSGAAGGEPPAGYEIVRELHRGGQGVVHEAIERRTGRRVAIKTLLAGAAASTRQRARLEREAELVASLRHPGIVALLAADVTPHGEPCLVMELVDGAPIRPANYAARPIGAALALFERIVEAVAYAHGRGVIHRDLKPGNILVDGAGAPRLLDFGIARSVEPRRAAAALTLDGEFVGTLAYAAPEQLAGAGDVADTRADVYALGVLLHEMLTGERPHAAGVSIAEHVRRVTESPVRSPRRLRRAIQRDLELVLLRMLARVPDERYQSAGDLLADLRRLRRGFPVEARPAGAAYVARRFARRHPLATSAALAAILTIAGFATVVTRLYFEADWEAQRSRAVIAKWLEQLAAVDAETSASAVGSVPEVLELMQHDLEELDVLRPAERARLQLLFADAWYGWRRDAEGLRHARDALASVERSRVADPELVAAAEQAIGRGLWRTERFAEALPHYERALTLRERALGPVHEDTVRTLHHLASTYRKLGRFDRAETLLERVVELREGLLDDHLEAANTLNELGNCLLDQGRPAEAAAAYRRGLAAIDVHASRRPSAEEPWQRGVLGYRLGACLAELGDAAGAAEELARAERVLAGHPGLAPAEHYLGRIRALRATVSSPRSRSSPAPD